jgi:hypothetical protein
MAKKLEYLKTTDEVMNVLGGTVAVAKLTQCKNVSAASNWRKFPTFPSHTYVVMIKALRRRGKIASPSLWGMIWRKVG